MSEAAKGEVSKTHHRNSDHSLNHRPGFDTDIETVIQTTD